jgi:hypothetical protein
MYPLGLNLLICHISPVTTLKNSGNQDDQCFKASDQIRVQYVWTCTHVVACIQVSHCIILYFFLICYVSNQETKMLYFLRAYAFAIRFISWGHWEREQDEDIANHCSSHVKHGSHILDLELRVVPLKAWILSPLLLGLGQWNAGGREIRWTFQHQLQHGEGS